VEVTVNGSPLLSLLGCALASASVPAPAPAPDSPFSQPAWSAREAEPAYGQGAALACAGDVDADGYSDVVAGSRGYRSYSGPVALYAGSAQGLSLSPSWSASSSEGGWFGYAVASAGDVNGDGFDDLIVGSGSDDGGHTAPGHAHLFLGSAGGLAAEAAWITESEHHWARYGASVASAGDIDGDGFDDVLVGVSRERRPDGGAGDGVVYAFLGSPDGLPHEASWSFSSAGDDNELGRSVAGVGDVNGDGFGDFVVASDEHLWGFHGSAEGPQGPVWELESPSYGMLVVAGAGDVDGDGYHDVLAGSEDATAPVTLFFGSPEGLLRQRHTLEPPLDCVGGRRDSSGAGDVNGDGYDDVLVACSVSFAGEEMEPVVFLLLGSAEGLSSHAALGRSDQGAAWYGGAVASAGDVDGDGYDDILVGSSPSEAGQVWQYAGMPCVEGGFWYPDVDGDGHPAEGEPATWCYRPAGYAAPQGEWDCDDGAPSVYPGAPEVGGDGIDQDCDGEDAEPCDSAVLDTSDPSDTGGPGDPDPQDKGEPTACGCGSARAEAPTSSWPLLLGALAIWRRRRAGAPRSTPAAPAR
jgi:hypothetical protein